MPGEEGDVCWSVSMSVSHFVAFCSKVLLVINLLMRAGSGHQGWDSTQECLLQMAWGLPMVEHIPLVRVHIARWGTADEGCWLSATFTSKFTSIFVASTTIPARRLLTIGGFHRGLRASPAAKVPRR